MRTCTDRMRGSRTEGGTKILGISFGGACRCKLSRTATCSSPALYIGTKSKTIMSISNFIILNSVRSRHLTAKNGAQKP